MLTTLNKPVGTLTPAEKKEKIQLHRDFHTALLNEYNVPDADFNVKLVFTNNNNKVVGIFPNEFKKENGFYIEFVDNKLDPTDPERKVYRLEARENYESVYNILTSGAYAVPIEELKEVQPKKQPTHQPVQLDPNFLTDNSKTTDEGYTKMTIRDLAAILWQTPVSNKSWLNQLINETKQQHI